MEGAESGGESQSAAQEQAPGAGVSSSSSSWSGAGSRRLSEGAGPAGPRANIPTGSQRVGALESLGGDELHSHGVPPKPSPTPRQMPPPHPRMLPLPCSPAGSPLLGHSSK